MKSSRSLKVLAELSQHHEQGAARDLGNARRMAERLEQQLKDLIVYRIQYIGDFIALGESGVRAPQLCDYHIFLARLDTAISSQRQQVDQYQQVVDSTQQKWLEKRGHHCIMDKLVISRQQSEAREQLRREQREADDHPSTIDMLSSMR